MCIDPNLLSTLFFYYGKDEGVERWDDGGWFEWVTVVVEKEGVRRGT